MPKISALPPMTTADAADEAPIVDTSATTTKKWTLTLLKTYLQSLTSWITTAMITNASVTADKLGLAGNRAAVATSQATSSTTYVDLATAGPSVTVTIGANGQALIIIACIGVNSTSGYVDMSFDISGANTISAATNGATNNRRLYWFGTEDGKLHYSTLFTGLTPGSTTFKAQYRAVSAGTATFSGREISVIPL